MPSGKNKSISSGKNKFMPSGKNKSNIFRKKQIHIFSQKANPYLHVMIILKKTHFFFLKIEKPRGSLCFLDTCFWEAYLAVRPSRHSHKGRFALQRRPRCDAVRALRQDNEALSALLTNLYFHKYLIISVPLSTQKTVVFGLLPENGGFLRVNTR